ncbi:MAG: hypothetical protein EXR72_10710 [Myxococcales bacterium]|nr:hypothetical protein [Myxococcales bacterium]
MATLARVLKLLAPIAILVGLLHVAMGLRTDVMLGAKLPVDVISDPVLDSQNRFYRSRRSRRCIPGERTITDERHELPRTSAAPRRLSDAPPVPLRLIAIPFCDCCEPAPIR